MSSADTTPAPKTAAGWVRPKWVPRWAWQLFIAVAGVVTIIVGIIMLPAPGPGSLVIYAGIGILATEFIWARQLCAQIRDWATYLFHKVRDWFHRVWYRTDQK